MKRSKRGCIWTVFEKTRRLGRLNAAIVLQNAKGTFRVYCDRDPAWSREIVQVFQESEPQC